MQALFSLFLIFFAHRKQKNKRKKARISAGKIALCASTYRAVSAPNHQLKRTSKTSFPATFIGFLSGVFGECYQPKRRDA
jgi:hypothetical protein